MLDPNNADSNDTQRNGDSDTIDGTHSTSGHPNEDTGNITWIAVSIGGFLFLISMLCVAIFVAKRKKDRKKKECHDTGMIKERVSNFLRKYFY